MPTFLKQQPIKNIQAFHSDVVTIEGPTHEGLQLAISELEKSDNQQLIYEAGLSESDILEGIDAVKRITTQLEREKIIVAGCMPNILFAGQKNQ